MISDKVNNRIKNIIAYYSAKSYINTNYKNGKRKWKSHRPYSLYAEAIEALEAFNAQDEYNIKRIILRFRFTHDDINLDMNCIHNNNFFCRYHLQKQKIKG